MVAIARNERTRNGQININKSNVSKMGCARKFHEYVNLIANDGGGVASGATGKGEAGRSSSPSVYKIV